MPTILISGAASGLGEAFVDAFIDQQDVEIIAIDRVAIESEPKANVKTYEVDVSSAESINAFAEQIQDVQIDMLIHSAGVRGLVPAISSAKPDDVAAAETISVMDMETMVKTYQINTAGTFMLLQALMGNFRNSGDGSPPKAIIMGSRMGSMGYNTAGGGYAYRASKAALNAIIKSFSIDVPEVIFTVIHPGRVETGLVASREEGAIEANESIKDMLRIIDKLTKEDSGRFYDRFGDPIVW